MKTIIFYFVIAFSVITNCFAQKSIRSALSCFGNGVSENGVLYRQTIGQSSATTVLSEGRTLLRQGFQQPGISLNSKSKDKVCTLYLSPNPTSNIVSIKLSEEIGEKQISILDVFWKIHYSIRTDESFHEMDVSDLPKGIYIVNVISKSGFHGNQKLIII